MRATNETSLNSPYFAKKAISIQSINKIHGEISDRFLGRKYVKKKHIIYVYNVKFSIQAVKSFILLLAVFFQ